MDSFVFREDQISSHGNQSKQKMLLTCERSFKTKRLSTQFRAKYWFLPVLLVSALTLSEQRCMPATDTLTHKLTTVCRASAPRHDESSSITVKSYWLPLLFRISVLQYSCDCYQTHQTGWTGCGLDTEHPQTPCHIQRYQTSIKFEGMCT